MNELFENKDDQIKVTIKTVMIMIAITLGLFLGVNRILIPLLQNTPDVTLMPIILMSMVLIYLFNASLNSSAINEMRMILDMDRIPIVLTVIPIISDIGMREYYEEFMYLEEDEYGNKMVSPLPMMATMVFSLLFTLSVIFFIVVITLEGVSYLTPRLITSYMLLLASFTALSISRSLAISEIILALSYKTYMTRPSTYKIISGIVAFSWISLFIVTPVLQFVGLNISYPLLNIVALFVPIFILPVITFNGIKQVRRDVVKDWLF